MSKADLEQLARVFNEAARASSPVSQYQYYSGQELAGYQNLQPLHSMDIEHNRAQSIVSSVLYAIAGAYQRAADETKD